MNFANLKARIRRLDELVRGLAKEVALWKECNDPLLYVERKSYLKGIQDALAALELARVTLVKVCLRLERESQERAPSAGWNPHPYNGDDGTKHKKKPPPGVE